MSRRDPPEAVLNDREKKTVSDYLKDKGLPVGKALTFEDVQDPTRYSDVPSRSSITDLRALLAGKVHTNIPIVSANMVPVTGAELSVALAREGGIGCVPQAYDTERRVEILKQIMRTDSSVIQDPLSITSDKTLRQAKELMYQYGIFSLVLVDHEGHPTGMLTTRDWKYETNDTMLVGELRGKHRLVTAPSSITIESAKNLLRENRIEKLPLVDERGVLVGLMTAHGLFLETHHPRALRDGNGRYLVIGSVGPGSAWTEDKLREVEAQVETGVVAILLDSPHAFHKNTGDAVVSIKNRFPDVPLIVGNVENPAAVKFLAERGADAVKVGIGPGAGCDTRLMTGSGTPQITAVAQCAAIARTYFKNVAIIADGGTRYPGDIAKALIAGANTIMLGAMLFCTEESEQAARIDNRTGLRVKRYYGSASYHAQEERMKWGTLSRVRVAEGADPIDMAVVGSVKDQIDRILGGLRSAMSFAGAWNLEELFERGTFVEISGAGHREGVKV